MSRPQVGIGRLPTRTTSNEPKEAMNYAVPKKRGPKTDVLEALLKRVDGLEKRLQNEKGEDSGADPLAPDSAIEVPGTSADDFAQGANEGTSVLLPPEPSQHAPGLLQDALLDTYFSKVHGKPYSIVDEASTRQRIQSNQLPPYLVYAIYAVSSRYAFPYDGYNSADRTSEEYARRARFELDTDEPTIEGLQTLLLLAQESYQAGKGRKAYMLLSSGISMAFALDLHRELPLAWQISSTDREVRRKLFWACYLMDRFSACGSKRPSLIADESIVLRLPSWQPTPNSIPLQGDFFPNGSNLHYLSGAGRWIQGSTGMLIGIVKTLGTTNRYLAAGGVKGDSHFPWHSSSNLSKVRQELDTWASETQDAFVSLDTLFGQPDSTILVLSKLVYHLIHCLLYRPFLPVDLIELSGTGQHQSWQIEATNLCFLHANAIAELVEIGKASSTIVWPAFVGYCICTAATIHVHGAHYEAREGDVFSASSEFLLRETQQLSELRVVWAGVQHQRDTLQMIYGAHTELVRSLATNPMRFSPVFQLEDFFDRYPGQNFDGAHLSFAELTTEAPLQSAASFGHGRTSSVYMGPNMQSASRVSQDATNILQRTEDSQPSTRPTKKRRSTTVKDMPPNLETKANDEPSASSTAVLPAEITEPHNQPTPTAAGPSDESSFNPDLAHLTPFAPSLAPFSPNFNFGTLGTDLSFEHMHSFDPMLGAPTPYDHQTPGAASAAGSTHTDFDKDPFLSLLEQLAENEHSRSGPSELDFFLTGSG
ncbi:hypothetical protein H2201_006318 [Coniosporium apollinis]|uniref:Xylanolytic transcriptional activator regulatory domain-containing protein n=1 Tax=Coniosporium apollinis TaxID=61459 RepID=A0ABQ9NQG1_9PEZI|nr:hypothetical protein H2201_006318 [Coniosporium apollinis]